MRVAGPAVFLAVGTVGWNAGEVALEAAPGKLMKPVQFRHRALEAADGVECGTDQPPFDFENLRLARFHRRFHEIEAVIDEARLPLFHAFAAQGVAVGLELAALHELVDIRRVDIVAVGVEEFGVTQFYYRSRFPPPPDPCPAGVSSPHIVNNAAVGGGEGAHRLDGAGHLAGRHGLQSQDSAGAGNEFRVLPTGIVETGRAPVGQLFARVVEFTVPERVEGDRPLPAQAFPGVVAGQDGFSIDFQLADQLGVVRPGDLVEMPAVGGGRVVPAIAENHADDVFSFLQQAGQIVFDVARPAVVLRHHGIENAVSHLFAVEIKLIVPESAKIKNGFALGGTVEFLAEIGRGDCQLR